MWFLVCSLTQDKFLQYAYRNLEWNHWILEKPLSNFKWRVVVNHFPTIIHAKIQKTSRRQLITASTTWLLVEGFHGLGNIKMANNSNILSIYTLKWLYKYHSSENANLHWINNLNLIVCISSELHIPSCSKTTTSKAVNATGYLRREFENQNMKDKRD